MSECDDGVGAEVRIVHACGENDVSMSVERFGRDPTDVGAFVGEQVHHGLFRRAFGGIRFRRGS